MNRLVEPEFLDTLPPDDPRAIRSRRDLRRVNWWMGNHAIMARALRNHSTGAPKHITELGAGDGTFLLRIAQKISPLWPEVAITLLDRQKIISPETLTAFARLGWRAEFVVADVFDWADAPGLEEVVIANLFLHHFEDAPIAGLLGEISRRTNLFIAIEPHRFSLPWLAGRLLWFIGCNSVTRHDGVVSIRAGFIGQEISALWPDKANWHLTESRAGLFSHIFIAQKRR